MVGGVSRMWGCSPACLDQLREHQLRTAARRRLGDPLAEHRLLVLRQHRQIVGFVEAGVPDVQHIHVGEIRASGRGSCGRRRPPHRDRRGPTARWLRAASTKEATSRLTSHSQGAGNVSSRSLMSKISRRSGVAKPPKFIRWASPHAWTWMPVVGVLARSAAMTPADPR